MASSQRRIRPYRVSGMYRQAPTPQQLTAGASLKEQLIADRGGADMISTAERLLIDCISMAAIKHTDIHSYLVALPRPWCNRKSHEAWRVVMDAARLEAHLVKLLQALGLERRAEPVEDVRAYAERLDAERAAAEPPLEYAHEPGIKRDTVRCRACADDAAATAPDAT